MVGEPRLDADAVVPDAEQGVRGHERLLLAADVERDFGLRDDGAERVVVHAVAHDDADVGGRRVVVGGIEPFRVLEVRVL